MRKRRTFRAAVLTLVIGWWGGGVYRKRIVVRKRSSPRATPNDRASDYRPTLPPRSDPSRVEDVSDDRGRMKDATHCVHGDRCFAAGLVPQARRRIRDGGDERRPQPQQRPRGRLAAEQPGVRGRLAVSGQQPHEPVQEVLRLVNAVDRRLLRHRRTRPAHKSFVRIVCYHRARALNATKTPSPSTRLRVGNQMRYYRCRHRNGSIVELLIKKKKNHKE